ncbi:LysR family transcriptional regulator [Spiractinospora alimapuensis]|uniref:LysR family transcriptional regulator n=1 Tax=Spiractinospora alimapuensis TaxID=2820884 RepID=UPI0022AAB33A|nr:LysR family transcriptional regulator [Spiractinospora alimapuensis]QVQ52863.1 LysR family transcriptional regulator [Spiractinospora alimapuensis]
MWDLHRLRLLHELHRHGTVTEVADLLKFSPSTVSAQLAKLEGEIGVPLFEPEGRRLRLTPHGVRIARHAAEVIDLEEQVKSELASARPVPETVRIATLETAGRALLPRALTTLASTHPLLRLEAAVVPPEAGLSELESRGYDLVIAEQYSDYTRAHRPPLDRVTLGADTLRLVVPAGSGITTLSQAREWPWVMEPGGTAARAWAIQRCRSAGFEPDIRFDSADLEIHIHLVQAGHAVSVLPDLVWSHQTQGVDLVDLDGPAQRVLFTSARRTTTDRPSIQAVRAALLSAFGDVKATRGQE